MLYSAWLVLVALSLGVSLAAFIWGLRNGQFTDQDRARYLPLREGIAAGTLTRPKRRLLEVHVLLFAGALSIAALIIALFLGRGR
jgi:cbb3-type cytochrome oxidase maturation protein